MVVEASLLTEPVAFTSFGTGRRLAHLPARQGGRSGSRNPRMTEEHSPTGETLLVWTEGAGWGRRGSRLVKLSERFSFQARTDTLGSSGRLERTGRYAT